MKRFINLAKVIVMALMLIISYLVPANAAEIVDQGISGENFAWKLYSDGTLRISGSGDIAGYENTWDDGIETHKDEIFQVVYEEGVKTIPDDAFRNYRNLRSVTFSDSLETIGYQDFMGCDSLTVLNIPRNVRSIGEHTFMCCEKLVNVNVDERNRYFASVDGVLFDKDISKLLFYPIARTDAFYQVPETVKVIRGPFYLYSGKDTPRCSLEKIVLPDHLERIENFAFQECRQLKEINLPDSLTYIGEGAFYHCEALEEAVIPKGITTLSATFAGCTNLRSVVIPDSVQEIWFAFNEDVMDMGLPYLKTLGPIGGDYSIQVSWTSAIPARAFMRCDTLQSAVIPDGVTSIGSEAFESCRSLSSVTIPASLKTVTEHAFYDCPALKDIYYNGTPAQWEQVYAENYNDALTAAKVHYKVNLSFNANGGTVNPAGKTVYTDSPYGSLPVPVRDHYRFDGWFTAAEGGTRVTDRTTVARSESHTLYAHWTRKTVYQVEYNANGGTGSPSAQTKEEGITLTLSREIPSKSFLLSYNAAGGSVSPAGKSLSCTFAAWNTSRDGSGRTYAPGAEYSADADVILYAQWQNPEAGDLAVPVRSGYEFEGWFTSASGGSRVYSDTVISADTTLYARWREEDVYNLGDETYSFANYTDAHSNGHCFGMSVTSAGYYNGQLDIRDIGGNENTPLYSFGDTQRVRAPICYYQGVQGNYISKSIVAGGSFYLRHYMSDISSDWPEVVDYVKNHSYDGTGLLQLIFWKGTSGHAVNFLRYENVSGQDRLYAYDNNFPKQEVYFYRDARGEVHEAPKQTIDGAIESVGLHDIRIFFEGVGGFDPAHVLYVQKGAAEVQGYEYSYMAGGLNGSEYVMYEIPGNVDEVTIIPSMDNADFIYMGTEYSFGTIEDDTYGVLTFAKIQANAVVEEENFRIYNGPVGSDPAACRVFGFCRYNGKDYWFEDGRRQAVTGDPKNIWDTVYGYERGREIFDPESNAWYWLDCIYDGAKAADKEVWMPYIFQSDLEAGINKQGKWVRYNHTGAMIKGWYTVRDDDVKLYPEQAGNTYYYDLLTGEMVKGDREIDGVMYHFDDMTGVLTGRK